MTSNNQLSSWTKKTPQSTSQSQTWTKKMSWSLFGDLLPAWYTIAFWIPTKSLHLRSVLSKSMRCTKNCNTCSWHWSTERAQSFTPNHIACHTTNASEVEQIGLRTKFGLIRHIHLTSCQPWTTTSSSISTTFCRENASTTSRRQKMLSKSSSNFEAQTFYATGKNKLISHWQKCVDCKFLVWLIKMCLSLIKMI